MMNDPLPRLYGTHPPAWSSFGIVCATSHPATNLANPMTVQVEIDVFTHERVSPFTVSLIHLRIMITSFGVTVGIILGVLPEKVMSRINTQFYIAGMTNE
jgi:hypothetical protein